MYQNFFEMFRDDVLMSAISITLVHGVFSESSDCMY